MGSMSCMGMSAMSSGLVIRNASEKDTATILLFIRELAEYERLSHQVSATEELLRRALFGERAVAEALIAEHEGEPVGFALFFRNFSTFLGLPGIYLEDLFIRPQWRGHGFGKALLLHIARLAKERGCGRLEWAVLDWNEPAIEFYRSLGAEAMDEWTVYRLTGDKLRDLAGKQV
jgi:GNAT superfamily N-acetyltransferase